MRIERDDKLLSNARAVSKMGSRRLSGWVFVVQGFPLQLNLAASDKEPMERNIQLP